VTSERFTYCRICEARCGLAVTVDGNRITRIAPDKQNPYSWRDFCVKGHTADRVISHPRRIVAPMKRTASGYVEVPWDQAIREIAAELVEIRDRDGADAIAVYTGNPWGFSGSNPMFASAFMDAVGTNSRYNVGSIDHNAMMVVIEAMYGTPLIGLVPDVDECACFLFVGMNPAESVMNWGGNVPNGWHRVVAAQKAGADLIVVDPRRTKTAERADRHVAIRPGTDWAFLLGVLAVIFDRAWDRVPTTPTTGIDELRRLAAAADLDDLSARCGVDVAVIEDVARRFATAPTAMCIARTGVSMNVTGTVGEWLSHTLNVVTDRVDRPGGRRYERGYVDMAKLIERMLTPIEHKTRVRGLPMVGGNHALAELPDEITTPGSGRVRALLIDCGNPVVSGPDGSALDAALAQLDLLVVLDFFQRESHRHADWLLPAAHWLERDDLIPVMGGLEDRPFVQLGRKVVEPPPGVREEWQIFTDLALAMDAPLFGKRGVNAVVRASRAVARVTRRPGAAFNPRWIWRLLVRIGGRVKWRDIEANPHGLVYGVKSYGDLASALRTADGRIQAAPARFVAEANRLLAAPAAAPPAEFPLALVGRRRMNSMNSWLNEISGIRDGFRGDELEINPVDAVCIGLADGDRARVTSATGSVELTARYSDAPRPGVVCAEHGWGSELLDPRGGGAPERIGVNRNVLVAASELDPISQIPKLNGTYVRVEPVATTKREEPGVGVVVAGG
jgi:formate dehydrogenase